MRGRLKLLQVEDSESDAELILRELRHAGYEVDSQRVDTAQELREALAGSTWDAVISDYRMPGFDAPDALNVLRETGLDIPFLVVSGTIGEDVAVGMMKAGAHDYLMKGNLARLAAAVEREVRDARMRAERRQAIETLAQRETQLALTIESTETGVFDNDSRTGKTYYSDLARKILLHPAGEEPSFGAFLRSVHEDDRERVRIAVEEAIRPGSSGRYAEEYRLKTSFPDEERWVAAWGKALRDESGRTVRFLGVVRDISEKRRAEREMQFQLKLTSCITEQSTDCIVLTDVFGRTRFINSETERLFGYSLEEFRDRTPHDLLHHHCPDGRPFPRSECPISRHMAATEPVRDFEDVFFHKDGTPIDVSVSYSPLELNGVRIGNVSTFRNITQRKQAERALRRSDERFRRLFDAQIVGIVISDGDFVVEANDYFLRLLGYSRKEFFGGDTSWKGITAPEHIGKSLLAFADMPRKGVCAPFEKEYLRKDGRRVPVLMAAVELSATPARSILCFMLDLTERKNLENQFRQAQKLESVGLLAGGVAHDFNNLLTVIGGYSDMVLDGMELRHPYRPALNQIATAASRAAALTKQLLTFSRRNPSAPRAMRLTEAVRGVEGMLRRLIGEDIEILFSCPKASEGDKNQGWSDLIFADPGLIEQVIVNLAVNARDAMPDGGKLFIEIAPLEVTEDFGAQTPVAPGRYVSLTVSDTGTGMSPEVQARIFEPFFTTKQPGKGTGLGLSTVYGIVKQSDGFISVHSTPGLGASFRVLFPASAEAEVQPPAAPQPLPARGTETILLVEDEAGVRHYVRDVLEACGYRVLDAVTGADALEIAKRYKGAIDLLITDLVLPGMNGAELIRECRVVRPGIATMRMSGYPERAGAQMGDDVPHLQKPFSREALLRRVREVLDRPGPAAARA